jgi:N-acetylglucosamine-6-sulfatase
MTHVDLRDSPVHRPFGFLRHGLLIALLAALGACQHDHFSPSQPRSTPAAAVGVNTAAGHPNILVIMTDDQNVEELRVQPHVRQLIGSAGVTFDNNVVTFALCCPSRATFLTGQYPHNHGVRGQAPPAGGYYKLDHTNTVAVWLQNAGYVTGQDGKFLNGYGTKDSLEVPPGWTEWYANTDITANRYFTYAVNENGKIVHYGTAPTEYKTDMQTDRAVDFIHRHAPEAAAGTTPFFLVVAYDAPHWGRPIEAGDPSISTTVPAPRHKGQFANEHLPPTPSFNEANVSDKPLHIRQQPLLTQTQINELQVAYRQRLESLLAVDEGVERIIGELETDGLLSNTLIIYTSDNGWFQGEHRIGFGKVFPYEPAVRVPLLIRGPGVVAGVRNTAPIANLDLAPTMVETGGVTAGRLMDGRSLWPFLSGAKTVWGIGTTARHIMIEDAPGAPAISSFWSIRRGVYVYTEYDNGDRELYNRSSDSAEVNSKHALASSATIRRQLATKLAAMKTCAGPVQCW